MKKFSILLISLTYLSCNSDDAPDFMKSTGKITTEKREISGDFSTIIAYKNIDVYVKEDTFYNVSVEAGKNLLPKITTKVINGVLDIDNKNEFNFVRKYNTPIKVTVTLPVLKNILVFDQASAYGLDTIRSSQINGRDNALGITNQSGGVVDLKLNVFYTLLSSIKTGSTKLSGKNGVIEAYVTGSGKLAAYNLENSIAYIYHYGFNNVEIGAKDILEGDINNTGNIYYKVYSPNLKVTRKIRNAGKVLEK